MITLGRVSRCASARVLAGQVLLEGQRLPGTVTDANGVSRTIAACRTTRSKGSSAKALSGPLRRSVADPGGPELFTGTGQADAPILASAQAGALPRTSILPLPPRW
jgi:hypothetical protein